jgi:hypothetical protein
MSQAAPSWQSTVIAVALIALVGAIFIVVYLGDGVEAALKAWAAVGTLIGVLTGAVPTYFFGQQQAAQAQQHANQARQEAAEERERRNNAEDKAALVLGYAPESAVEKAQEVRPDLFQGG